VAALLSGSATIYQHHLCSLAFSRCVNQYNVNFAGDTVNQQTPQMESSWLRYCDSSYFDTIEVRKSLRACEVAGSLVDCKLNKIRWVRVEEKDVAVLELQIRCTGPSKSRIKSASINLRFSQSVALTEENLLNVIETAPDQWSGKHLSNKHIEKHAELAPEVEGAGAKLKLGSVGKSTSMDQEQYWTFTTTPSSDTDDNGWYRRARMHAEVCDDSCYAELTATPLHAIVAIEGVRPSVGCSTEIEMVMKRWFDKSKVSGQQRGTGKGCWPVPFPQQLSERKSYPSMDELIHDLKEMAESLNLRGGRPRSRDDAICVTTVQRLGEM
jgi:hypothetical protein